MEEVVSAHLDRQGVFQEALLEGYVADIPVFREIVVLRIPFTLERKVGSEHQAPWKGDEVVERSRQHWVAHVYLLIIIRYVEPLLGYADGEGRRPAADSRCSANHRVQRRQFVKILVRDDGDGVIRLIRVAPLQDGVAFLLETNHCLEETPRAH